MSHINENVDVLWGRCSSGLQSWPSVKPYFTKENDPQRRQSLSEAAPLQPRYTSGLSGT